MGHKQTVNHVLAKTSGDRKLPCLAFIDHEKTFDPLETVAVFNANQQQCVLEAYCRVLKDI